MKERILFEVILGPNHPPTGRTTHIVGGRTAPTPHRLRIVQCDGDDSMVYLFYCDETGEPFTDTWHASVEDAMAQAEWEFKVAAQE